MKLLNQQIQSRLTNRRLVVCFPILFSTGLIVLCLVWLRTPQLAQGQSEAWDAPDVTVDETTFPTVTVRFICSDTQRTVDDFLFFEDLQVLSPTHLYKERITPPTQVAIVLDLYRRNDLNTLRKTDEIVANLVEDLVALRNDSTSSFSVTQDSLAIMAPGRPVSTPQSILTLANSELNLSENSKPLTFTYDINSLINMLNSEEFRVALPELRGEQTTTKLWDLLLNVIDTFPQTPAQRRSLLLFSDGTDETSIASLEEVVQKAVEHQLAIYTVYIDTTQPGDRERLRELAQKTGGRTADGSIIKDLYAARQRCNLVYHTQKAQPENLIVLPKDKQGLAATVAITFPKLAITPPLIIFKWPQRSTTITKDYTLYLENVVQWDFGRFANRRIVSVTYEIKGPATAIYRNQFSISPSTPYTSYKYIISTADLTPGNYLVKVTVVDNVGLSSANEQPFALYALPKQPPPTLAPSIEEPAPNRWAQFVQWLATIQHYLLSTRLPLLQAILWSVGMALLIALLLYWRNRRRRYTDLTEGELILPSQYSAALVRIRMDPDAPPLLHMAPLGHRTEIDIPDYLYHPIGKNYQINDLYKDFREWYQAKIVLEKEGFIIRRKPRIVRDQHDMPILRHEPIGILVAETSQAFMLIDDVTDGTNLEFGPLYHGDIVQLGKTHYRFMHIKPADDSKPDARRTSGNGTSVIATVRRSHWWSLPWLGRLLNNISGEPKTGPQSTIPSKSK